jgi:hypothetical protein
MKNSPLRLYGHQLHPHIHVQLEITTYNYDYAFCMNSLHRKNVIYFYLSAY